jgi:hypothetical protein
VVLVSDTTAILEVIRTKNCFALRSKVPFITDQLQPILHFFSACTMQYNVILVSNGTAMLGEILTKNCFGLKSKVTFITDRDRSNWHCI